MDPPTCGIAPPLCQTASASCLFDNPQLMVPPAEIGHENGRVAPPGASHFRSLSLGPLARIAEGPGFEWMWRHAEVVLMWIRRTTLLKMVPLHLMRPLIGLALLHGSKEGLAVKTQRRWMGAVTAKCAQR